MNVAIRTKTRAIGGSLVVTIPIEIVKSQKIQENEEIEITVRKAKKDFFGAFRGVGKFTKEDELKGQFDE